VIASGIQAAVQELHEWLRRGPPLALVTSVEELDAGDVNRPMARFSVE
jgi:acylphosphatase